MKVCLASGPDLGKCLPACIPSERNRNQACKYFDVSIAVFDPLVYIKEPFFLIVLPPFVLLTRKPEKLCFQAFQGDLNNKDSRLRWQTLKASPRILGEIGSSWDRQGRKEDTKVQDI